MIATFDLEKIYFNPELNSLLSSGDSIFIPNITQQIYVYGAVNSPGTTIFNNDAKVQTYINAKGGFAEGAIKDLIYVIQPNGESYLVNNPNFKIFGQSKAENTIYPGSFIFVTPRLDISAEQSAAIWAPLISSFALTLASLSALN